MIDHVSIGSENYSESVAFYRAALAPLGIGLQRDKGDEAAFGTDEHWGFYVYPVEPGRQIIAPRMHIAFTAPSRAEVERAHVVALASGAREVRAPQERPDISKTYYGGLFTDLDGHKIEILTNK
jgi:catechol 2,3-dioxygenase-like lactoylglutathione lyase family enzyme